MADITRGFKAAEEFYKRAGPARYGALLPGRCTWLGSTGASLGFNDKIQ
jgi:hypothetical protein